jgi:hypothetical protein
MNLGIENKKKAITAGVLGGLALLFLIWQLSGFFSSSAPPPAAPPVIKTLNPTGTPAPATSPSPAPAGKITEPIANSAAQLDPTLRMEGMLEAESLVYGGSGRNIFSTQSAPPPIPKVIAPARPTGPPPPPAPYVPPPPPPPPPIQLTFFGTVAAKNGTKRAFLVHGDDVFLAGPGDIVDRRYRIVNILPNGIAIEDLPNNNTQILPLTH